MPDLRCTNCNLCHESKGFGYDNGGRVEYHVSKINSEGDGSNGIMLIGMNPGEQEVVYDRPFIGEAGQRLRSWLERASIDAGACRITNVVRCRTPQNRVPERNETDACAPFLQEEIAQFKPKVMVLFGAYVIKEVAGISLKVKDAIGRSIWSDKYQATLMFAAHPSYFVRMGSTPTADEERCVNVLKEAKEMTSGIRLNAAPADVNYQYATTPEKALRLIEKLLTVPGFSYDTETTSTNWRTCEVLCLSFSWKEKTAAVLPMHLSNPNYDVDHKLPKMWDKDTEAKIIQGLKKVFTRTEGIKIKIGQNVKFDNHVLHHSYGIRVKGKLYDTMLADYLIMEEKEHDLKTLALLQTDMGDYDSEMKALLPNESMSFATVPHEILWKYSAADADAALRIANQQFPELKRQDLEELFFKIVMPYCQVLEKMEDKGILVDLEKQKELDQKYTKLIADLEDELIRHPLVKECERRLLAAQGEKFGERWDALKVKRNTREEYIRKALDTKEVAFNVQSPKQVAMLIYDVCRLTTPRGFKPGQTSVDVLEVLQDKSPVIKIIMRLRTLNKFFGTYIHNVPEFVQEDGRVHTTYNQHRTDTGRLSSTRPNFQNQPKRGEEAHDVRAMYISPPGYVLLEADYKQAEFRYWGAYARDEKLKAAIESGFDPHTHMAKKYLGLTDDATPDDREWKRFIAKMTVFGIMYGRGAKSISEEYDIALHQAQAIIDDFLGEYSQAAAWLDATQAYACAHGYVPNWFGRRRHLHILKDSDPQMNQKDNLVAAALRQAMNAPIQGGSHDHLSCAALRIDARQEKEKLNADTILDIHDALVFEVKEEDLPEFARMVKYEMERPLIWRGVPFPIKMEVDLSVGTRWSEMKKYKVEEFEHAEVVAA